MMSAEAEAAPATNNPTTDITPMDVKHLAASLPGGVTEGGIRWDLYNRDLNGLAKSGAIIRRGRRILIIRERYLTWLASKGEGPR